MLKTLLVAVATGLMVVSATAACAGESKEPMPALERVESSEKGSLKNPYSDDDADIVEEGRKLYLQASCNGCHGGGGGGGMCPPLSNETWVYGGDDDTLFRLITLGSQDLQAKGYMRRGMENVNFPMIPQGQILKTDDNIWKVITFIRSNYRGVPEKKYGDQPHS